VNPSHKSRVDRIDEPIRPVVRVTDKVTEMSEPMPQTETERTEEAQRLLAQLTEDDLPLLTSWELSTITDLREGKAATAFRLRELRAALKRIHAKKA